MAIKDISWKNYYFAFGRSGYLKLQKKENFASPQ